MIQYHPEAPRFGQTFATDFQTPAIRRKVRRLPLAFLWQSGN